MFPVDELLEEASVCAQEGALQREKPTRTFGRRRPTRTGRQIADGPRGSSLGVSPARCRVAAVGSGRGEHDAEPQVPVLDLRVVPVPVRGPRPVGGVPDGPTADHTLPTAGGSPPEACGRTFRASRRSTRFRQPPTILPMGWRRSQTCRSPRLETNPRVSARRSSVRSTTIEASSRERCWERCAGNVSANAAASTRSQAVLEIRGTRHRAWGSFQVAVFFSNHTARSWASM